jgi:hypothetical protein
MSALPPKADKEQMARFVRFVPKADSCSAAKIIANRSPVSALLKLRRHLGAESLGRFDKFEFDWLGTTGPSRRS